MSAQNDQPPSLTDRIRAIYDKVWWLAAVLFFGGFIWLGFTGRILLLLRLFGALFAVVGLHAILYGWWSRTQARRSEYWFPAEGRVLNSQVEVRADTSSDSPRTAIDTYWPRIEYEYQFQGETYRSDRIILVEVNYPRKQAEALVARNPVGARVQVYVDPDHPRRAVLEKGLAGEERQYSIFLIAGGIFLPVGLLICFFAPYLSDSDRSHYNLGTALLNKGDLDGAAKEFREAIRLKPGDPYAHNSLGIALDKKKDWDGAIREYRETIRFWPDNPYAHYNLGWELANKNDWDGATKEFRETIRLKPDYAGAHDNLGVALKKQNDLDGAVKEYREAIRLQPDDPDARNNLGEALEQRGDLQPALEEYRKACELDRKDPAYCSAYERLREKLKN